MTKPDYIFEDHGSMFLLRPMNDDAKDHLIVSTNDEFSIWFGDALCVDPRFVYGVGYDLHNNGWVVS